MRRVGMGANETKDSLEIEALRAENAALKAEVKRLETENTALKADPDKGKADKKKTQKTESPKADEGEK